MGPEDEFFLFSTSSGSGASQLNRNDKTQLKYAQYLEDSCTEFNMLHKYPYVKQVFMKYNTPVPSSAPVERLFSFGGLIHAIKRNRLSDKMFEALLMMKANEKFANVQWCRVRVIWVMYGLKSRKR